MVINNMSEMVSGNTVALEENEVHIVAGHFKFSSYGILDGNILVCLHSLVTENPLHTGSHIGFDLLYSETAALFGVFTVDTGVFLIGGLLFTDCLRCEFQSLAKEENLLLFYAPFNFIIHKAGSFVNKYANRALLMNVPLFGINSDNEEFIPLRAEMNLVFSVFHSVYAVAVSLV